MQVHLGLLGRDRDVLLFKDVLDVLFEEVGVRTVLILSVDTDAALPRVRRVLRMLVEDGLVVEVLLLELRSAEPLLLVPLAVDNLNGPATTSTLVGAPWVAPRTHLNEGTALVLSAVRAQGVGHIAATDVLVRTCTRGVEAHVLAFSVLELLRLI